MMKKQILGPILPIWPKFGPQNVFCGFYLYYMLDIVANYPCMQFQGKHMIQTHTNGEKLHFGPDLDPLDPNSSRQFFFSKVWPCQSLNTKFRYQHVKYQIKLMIQS